MTPKPITETPTASILDECTERLLDDPSIENVDETYYKLGDLLSQGNLNDEEFAGLWILRILLDSTLQNQTGEISLPPARVQRIFQDIALVARGFISETRDLETEIREFGLDVKDTEDSSYRGYYLEESGIKFFVPTSPNNMVSLYGQDYLPSMDETVTDPSLAPPIINWFRERVKELKEKSLRGSPNGVDLLCFIEKPYGGSGAITLWADLVVDSKINAFLYRPNRWDDSFRIQAGWLYPQARITVITDTIPGGEMIRDTITYLKKSYGARVNNVIALFDWEVENHNLNQEEIHTQSFLRRSQVEKVLARRIAFLREVETSRHRFEMDGNWKTHLARIKIATTEFIELVFQE